MQLLLKIQMVSYILTNTLHRIQGHLDPCLVEMSGN